LGRICIEAHAKDAKARALRLNIVYDLDGVALVVFASSRTGRLLAGAWLFGAVSILQLHAQAMGLPCRRSSCRPCAGFAGERSCRTGDGW